MHNILYRTYPENTRQVQIVNNVLDIVRSNGDGYGTDRIQFLSDAVCDSREDAEAYIEQHDRAFYGGYAVRFYDIDGIAGTTKTKELAIKRFDVVNARHEYMVAHSPQSFKAEYVGCKDCGSKLSRKHLRGNICPLCHSDLRSASTLERIKKYDETIKAIDEKIKAEKLKAKNKVKVYWLVKFEYHS